MTTRNEITRLAAEVDGTVSFRDGRVFRIIAFGETYGDGCMLSLLDFAERARRFAAGA